MSTLNPDFEITQCIQDRILLKNEIQKRYWCSWQSFTTIPEGYHVKINVSDRGENHRQYTMRFSELQNKMDMEGLAGLEAYVDQAINALVMEFTNDFAPEHKAAYEIPVAPPMLQATKKAIEDTLTRVLDCSRIVSPQEDKLFVNHEKEAIGASFAREIATKVYATDIEVMGAKATHLSVQLFILTPAELDAIVRSALAMKTR